MCKKLVFLISLVSLLGVSSAALAANLTIPWGTTHTVTSDEEWDEVIVEGYLIIQSGATFVANSESTLDGNGDDGEGGDGATIIINGGTFIINNRLNMGADHDGFVHINNGGTFIQRNESDGIKIPDNDGGVQRIYVNDGTLTADAIEIGGPPDDPDRNGKIELGCGSTITVGSIDESDDYDPSFWLTVSPPRLSCTVACAAAGGIVMIEDKGGNVKEATCFILGPEAWKPSPKDGAVAVRSEVTKVTLTWNPGSTFTPGTADAHVLYFGTDYDRVKDATFMDPEFQYYGDVASYQPMYIWGGSWPVGNLPHWTKFCWRVDEYIADLGEVYKGDVWTFTTGCPVLPGDKNLDCRLNFKDWATFAEKWQMEQMWP